MIKKNTLYLSILLFFASIVVFAQDSLQLRADAIAFQKKLNSEFSNKEESPLTEEDLKKFDSLPFFKIDHSFIVVADFVRTPYASPFTMATTTNRKPIYVKYGEVYFTLKGKKYKLNIYQSQRLVNDPEYENYLFLPFTDLTNGNETYAGGRYLDLEIPRANKIVIDFNQAYNPYCAYNGRYSCPIPPEENHLEIAIKAGVKKSAKHKSVK